MEPELVQPSHLGRQAIVYVRQSTPHQVLTNQESLRLQYALRQRARDLGWREADVAVIDADLGVSAAGASHREGYKELVARVAAGEVGIILSADVTRLARNCTDWYPLLDVCGHRQCLIADRDGVYDPGTPNGRLLLGLKGTISEVELHTIRGRLTAGLLAKAGRGELAVTLPTGLARDPFGVVTKDPDLGVQARVSLVFSTFLRVRTAVGTMRELAAQGLALPRRNLHGDTVWRPPTLMAVIDILKNPAYAGAFVYGRTAMRHPRGTGALPSKVPRHPSEWRIVVRDKYPAYVDWETHERIQALLRENRAEYERRRTKGVPRDGSALLHGLVWCGECGHKARVQYKHRGAYVCNQARTQNNGPVCQRVPAGPVDDAVAAAFLEAVSPAEAEAWARARQGERKAGEALRRAHAQQVERLRYQASLAERQFNRVDPDNRLVAAELERRWEAALLELRHAEEDMARNAAPRGGGAGPTPGVLVQLGPRVSEIWGDPTVGDARRKALLRCLVDKVVLRREAPGLATVRVVWRGGAVTELAVPLLATDVRALSSYPAMEGRLRSLVAEGLSDREVAGVLTAEGFRSPREASRVHRSTVATLRRRIGLAATRVATRWRVAPGKLSVTAMAARLGVPPNRLYGLLRRGKVRLGRDDATGRYLFPDRADVVSGLRQVLAGDLDRVDVPAT